MASRFLYLNPTQVPLRITNTEGYAVQVQPYFSPEKVSGAIFNKMIPFEDLFATVTDPTQLVNRLNRLTSIVDALLNSDIDEAEDIALLGAIANLINRIGSETAITLAQLNAVQAIADQAATDLIPVRTLGQTNESAIATISTRLTDTQASIVENTDLIADNKARLDASLLRIAILESRLQSWDYTFIEGDTAIAPYSKLMTKEAGDLTIWDAPKNGQWFTVQDSAEVLKVHKNKLIAADTDTIGKGQIEPSSNEFVLNPDESSWGGDDSLVFVYSGASKNWLVGASGRVDGPIPEVTQAELDAVIAQHETDSTQLRQWQQVQDIALADHDAKHNEHFAKFVEIEAKVNDAIATNLQQNQSLVDAQQDRGGMFQWLQSVQAQINGIGQPPVTVDEETTINTRLTALEERPIATPHPISDSALAALIARLEALESNPPAVTAAEEQALLDRIAELESQVSEPIDVGNWVLPGLSTIKDVGIARWNIVSNQQTTSTYRLPDQIGKNTVSLRVTAYALTSFTLQWISGGQQIRRTNFNWNGNNWSQSGEIGATFEPLGSMFDWSFGPTAIADGRTDNYSGLRLINFSGDIVIEEIRFTNA